MEISRDNKGRFKKGGTGRIAGVNEENRIIVEAVSASVEHHVNHHDGAAFNALFAVNPDGADDCIFYLKNEDDKDLVIEGVWWQTSAAEEVYYQIGDTGTAVKTNGADITPVNLNAGSGKTADAVCYSNTADGAVDITGLSGGSTFQKLWLTSATSEFFNMGQDVILPKNQTFTICCVGGDTLLRGTVVFNFHGKDAVG